jgi:hypothetical protein
VSAAPEHDAAAVGDQDAGELAAGRRLARAVDADDEHDGGPAVLVREGPQRPVGAARGR